MKLYLGVVDQQYSTGTSTSEVATILERKYHIMSIFANKNQDYIANQLAKSFSNQISSLTKPVDIGNYNQATNNISQKFKTFLDRNGTGIVTRASISGKSSRFKSNSKSKGNQVESEAQVRPSFIDTGLYQASMIAWVDQSAKSTGKA